MASLPGSVGRRLHRTLPHHPHVALFLPTLEVGGAERTMVNLSAGLAELGSQVDLVVADAHGPFVHEVPDQVRLVDLRAQRTMASLPGLVRYLRNSCPEILLSTMNHANLVAIWSVLLARAGTRVFVREASTLTVNTAAASTYRARFLPALMRWTYPLAAGVIVPSRGVARDLENAIALRGVHIIGNPVMRSEMKVAETEEIRHPFFARGQPPVVLGVGRLESCKDFPNLLHGFALARAERALRLVVLGEGSLRRELVQLARDLGVQEDVSFPGFVANPFAFMSRAGVFVLSSTHEGLPNVLIQAMGCGCPVVSTDCESGPREILEGGRLGPLVPVGDSEALAAAMLDVLESPQAEDELRARAADFGVRAIASEYLACFARHTS